MKRTTWLLRVIGFIQIILGAFYLFAPNFFLTSMGHTAVANDVFYPLAMLAGRFIAYGIAFIFISGNPFKYKLWIQFMVLIQAIDLLAGLFYTFTGVVDLSLSGFPMFNAIWIIVLLVLWMPKEQKA